MIGRISYALGFRVLLGTALAGLVAGCTGIGGPSPDEVSVDIGGVAEFLPNSRHWLGWPAANEHCAAQGKSPQLKDIRGSVVTYRCVAEPDGS